VELQAELDAIAAAAAAHAGPGEALSGVLPTEPEPDRRVYLCSYDGPEARSWLALDADGRPLRERGLVRAAVSIAALCELAEDAAGGGHLEELRSELLTLRLTESPEGIEEAEEAALELERTIGAPPRLATPAHLDAIGAATRRLEQALGEVTDSPFGAAMQHAMAVVGELETDVLGGYKVELS
jgi:hypothetical protein